MALVIEKEKEKQKKVEDSLIDDLDLLFLDDDIMIDPNFVIVLGCTSQCCETGGQRMGQTS